MILSIFLCTTRLLENKTFKHYTKIKDKKNKLKKIPQVTKQLVCKKHVKSNSRY